MQRQTFKLLLLLSIIINILIRRTQSQSLTVSLSTRTINANSAYNFVIIDENLQRNDGTITIGFPAGRYTIGAVTCYDTRDSTVIYPCTVVASIQVAVTFTRGLFPNSYFYLSIATIQNPSSKQTLTFSYTFASSGTNLTVLSADADILTPDVLSSCSIAFFPSTVNTQGTIIVSMTIKNAIDSNASITLTFPSTWNQTVSSLYPPLLYSSATCTKVSGTSLKSILNCDKFGNNVQLGNALASAAISGSTFVFNVSIIRSPPTTATTNLITITTQTSNGNQVDQSQCSITAVSEQSLTLSSTSNFIVGNSSILSMTWNTASPLKADDVLTITLPTSFMSFVQYGAAQLKYSGTKFPRIIASLGNSSLQERYSIFSLSSSDTQISNGAALQFSNFPVSCLIDTSPRSISLSISRSGFGIASGTLTITPQPNILRNVTIAAGNRIVSATTSLTFTFITWNSLTLGANIRIQIPSSITITNASPTCSISSPTNPAALATSITCSITSNLLVVSSFLVSSLSASSTLVLVVNSAFRNPQTTEPTTAFIIRTTSSSAASNNIVDQNTFVTYSAEAGTIGSLTITPSSFVVANANQYIVNYTVIRTIKSGSTISITLPEQINRAASVSYTYSLNNAAFTTTSATVSIVNGTTSLSFAGLITRALTTGDNIIIRMANLINPGSLQPSSSFKVYINNNGFPIEMLETGLTVTMTTLTSFRQILRQVVNPTNGEAQDYTFYLKPLVAIPSGARITIAIVDMTNGTNQITLSTSVSCSISTSSGTIASTCTSFGSTVTIILGGQMSDTTGSTQYTVVISSMILARTYRTSSSFRITSLTSTGFGVQTTTVDSILNSKTNNMDTISLTVLSSPSQLNERQQLRITIKTFNGINLLDGQYLVIYIPQSFTYSGSAVTSICTTTIFTCTFFNANNYAIKVTNSSLYTTVGLAKDFVVTLNQSMYVSPLNFDYTTDYFLVRTYTNNNLPIDDTSTTRPSTQAAFVRTCGGRCKTCSATNTSFCQTCYVPNTGVISNVNFGGFNTKTSDGFCVDACSSGYYNNSGVCFPCQIPCQSCTSVTACTTCSTGYYFTTVNTTVDSRCRSTCPTGTFANNSTRTCQTCSPQCASCSSISNFCTSCPINTYLSGSQCVPSCPDGTFQNTANNQCNACDVGCLSTCRTTATQCDACKSGYYRPNSTSSQCINQCPTGSVKNNATGICGCSSSCATCSGTLDSCLTCQSGLILSGTACVSQCPSQTYKPTNQSVCRACSFANCSNCTQTQCVICMSTYNLYSGSCVLNCPQGTRSQNRSCVSCSSNCASCPIANTCTQCFTGFLLEGSSCVSACSPGLINFNATSCVSSCPIGYTNVSNRCQSSSNGTVDNGNNTVVVNNTEVVGRIIPFPYTIAYVLVVGVSIGMRCLYPGTLLPSVMMSLGSILEMMSAITLIIVGFLQLQGLVAGLAIIIVSVVLIYIQNFVALIMIIKVLHNDTKFMMNYKKKPCPNIIIRVIAISTYHKFHQIVFSNIFGVKVFCNKVDYVRRLYPFNVLLIISLFLSVLLVVGGSLVGYQVQALRLSSSTFIQSVDCILIVVLNVIPTILVLRRKDKDYEQQINDKQAKRYETQDQLNMNNDSAGIEDVFIEESGDAYGKPSKVGQSRKNYFYQNSKKSQNGQDPYESPLDKKRLASSNPINAQNFNGQKSSQSLFFGDKSKIKSNINPLEEVSEELEQIVLQQPVRDNLIAQAKNNEDDDDAVIKKKEDKNLAMLNYTGYDLDPKLLALNENSEEFKKLPSETKAKIRLAKANLQINKNSKLLANKEKTLESADVEQIQLSPKKNKDLDRRQSMEDPIDTSGAELLNESLRKQVNSELHSSPKSKNKSKSKSKSKQKNKKSLDKRYEDGKDGEQKKQVEQARMVRNQSQQIKKKDLLNSLNQGTKTTKSQNIKKKKKKPNADIKVLYNGNQNNAQQQLQKNQLAVNDEEYEEDQPTLPVFKHRSKSKGKRQNKLFDDSDGLDNDGRAAAQQDGKNNQKGYLSNRKTQNLDDKLHNLRAMKGERTIPNQQPDDLPQLHSSEQLSNLVIVNRTLKNRKSGEPEFSNDDSSIYKKIYNDETETLKSVQGDNMFGNEVSPSQFNIQNQRFEDSSASNDMPIPATFEDDDLDDQADNEKKQDGFDQHGSHIRRYESTHNIDYDSVLSKRINNDRIKQLQKIYLPRLQVIKPKKKKK